MPWCPGPCDSPAAASWGRQHLLAVWLCSRNETALGGVPSSLPCLHSGHVLPPELVVAGGGHGWATGGRGFGRCPHLSSTPCRWEQTGEARGGGEQGRPGGEGAQHSPGGREERHLSRDPDDESQDSRPWRNGRFVQNAILFPQRIRSVRAALPAGKYSHPSGSVGGLLQDPLRYQNRGCSTPLHKMA